MAADAEGTGVSPLALVLALEEGAGLCLEHAARAHRSMARLMDSPCTLSPAMKLYTKTGDDGTTGLFGGGRVKKASVRVDAYGTVDELNAFIGAARETIEELFGK